MNSGRSSLDSTEGSDTTNNFDLDDDDNELDDTDVTHITVGDRFAVASGGDSFDTDEDDDENGDFSLDISRSTRTRHPRYLIKSVRETIIKSLVSSLLQTFLTEQQSPLQRYAKALCTKNSVALRHKLRPSSLPPRGHSQNRYSLPVNTSNVSTFQQQLINAQSAFRATPEPTLELKSILRVTPLRNTNPVPMTAAAALTSPRKSQVTLPPPPERTSTSLAIEKRNPQQIALVGTAVTNLPIQVTLSTPQPSQTQARQTPSTLWRYRSATTINSNIQNPEPITRLPPISIERLSSSDQLVINRSNPPPPPATTTTAIVEPIPPVTRIVSGNSTGSNFSSTVKIRTLPNTGKLQRPSRPVTISSNKDLNNSTSTSPARSITTSNIPSSALKTTAITRSQPQQKRPPITSKNRPPQPSNTLKVPSTHLRQMTKEHKIASMDTIVSSHFYDSSSQLLSDS